MNTTDFLKDVKNAITVPTYQARFDDNDLLDLANGEIVSTIVPMITSLQEEFFVVPEDISVAAGDTRVQIPYRAAGRILRELHYLQGTNEYNLPRYSLTESFRWTSNTSGEPCGFYIQGDFVYLVPVPDSAGTLKTWYYLNPSMLVSTDRTNTIDSVTNYIHPTDPLQNKFYVTVSAAIATNIVIGSLVDITQFRAGYRIIYKDLRVTNKSNRDIYLEDDTNNFSATNLITGVVANDSISLAEETSIIQLPREATGVLISATAVQVLQALAIPEHLKIAEADLQKKIIACKMALAPRVDGESVKIINRNGLLSGRNTNRRFPRLTV